MKLSENFTLKELTDSETALRLGLDNTPNQVETANLKRLAEFLEKVRSLLNKPIIINSGFRSKAVNDAIESNDRSQHRLGCAADIRVPGMTPNEVCSRIFKSDLQFDQLIREFDSWTHISIPNTPDAKPRRSALIIDKTTPRGRPFTG